MLKKRKAVLLVLLIMLFAALGTFVFLVLRDDVREPLQTGCGLCAIMMRRRV